MVWTRPVHVFAVTLVIVIVVVVVLAMALRATLFAIAVALLAVLVTFSFTLRVIAFVALPFAVAGKKRHNAHPGLNGGLEVGSLPARCRRGSSSSEGGSHAGRGKSHVIDVDHGKTLRNGFSRRGRSPQIVAASGPKRIQRGTKGKVSNAPRMPKMSTEGN
jgi:hypothetical protein